MFRRRGATGGEIEGEEALGSAGVRGSKLVGKGGGVNGRVTGAIGEVPDGLSESWQTGQAGGAEGAGGVILEGLVAIGLHVLDCGLGNQRFELLLGGDVDAALRDPVGLEAAGGANVEVGVELVDVGLEGVPA